ncbi:hypothetical protein Syun_005398 [Stephania yunnanensis]|uniref:Uncharacterized protein n=1 Tax=Stephania yunnanensis TaxID=152371 RepID=A0AAP0L503_9MAGN
MSGGCRHRPHSCGGLARGGGSRRNAQLGIVDDVDRGAGKSVGNEIGGESEVEGVVGAVVLVAGGQGSEGGVVAVAPRPREVGEEGVSEELLGAVEPVGEMGAEAMEEESATPSRTASRERERACHPSSTMSTMLSAIDYVDFVAYMPSTASTSLSVVDSDIRCSTIQLF